MSEHFRAVVIGGGVTGCSVLYHLAKAGWRESVLLERSELTSGSSWHAAGSIFALTAPSCAAVLQRYTRELYPVLEEESGQPLGYHQCGGVSIAKTAEEVVRQKILQDRCRRNGIPSEFLSLHELKQLVPFIDTTTVLSALYEPGKGYIDPSSVVHAYAAAARKLGATIRRHAPVLATRQLQSGEWEVDTPAGTLRADVVVNAAGLWAREVAAQAGIVLPLMPVEHHYLVTEAVPELAELGHEMPNVSGAEHNWYCRQEGKGLLLGAYESTCVHWAEQATPLDFGHELLPDDLARIDDNLADAIEVLPVLATAGVKRVINGPMIFSPDLAPLLGPYPGKRNYVCAAGVMTGFNQGGGVGKVVAEWIVDGEPSLDVTPWDVARYGGWAGRSYTKARSGYFYEHRSHRVYPGQQFEAGRPVRTTPIHAELTKRGAVWGESFGLEVPLWYARPGDEQRDRYGYGRQNWFDAVVEEGRAVRDGVGLFEIASFSKFLVSGSGARVWLDRLLAGAIPAPGRTALSPMLSPKGRLIGDFTVSTLEEDRFLLIGSGVAQRIHERWFDLNLTADDQVLVENLSSAWTGLHIAGPLSRELLARVAGSSVGNQALPFMANRRMDLDGCPEATVVRVSFSGELGYEIHFPQQYELAFLSRLLEAGKDLGLRLAGSRALMWLRLEKAYPSWGLELSPDYFPSGTGLDRFVRWDKGDFVGREAAAVQRGRAGERLVTLVVDAEGADCWGGESVFRDGEHVGYVTSGGFGPAVGESLALGYLRTPAVEEGVAVEVLVKGEPRPAVVRTAPRYDPQGLRLRS